jgi:hypothetical protein
MGESWRDSKGRLLPGNPLHRPRGSRNILGEAFLADIYQDWIEHGIQAVRQTREEEPSAYLKIIAYITSKCEDSVFD